MVKGCQKKTIHIKDTGSKYYEEAYCVLRPGVGGSGGAEPDMITEAMRIAGESISSALSERKRSTRQRGIVPFLIGAVAGGVSSALLCLVLFL